MLGSHWRRFALALLPWLALSISGCGGKAGQASGQFVDAHPLPVDTMTVWAPEIGTHGGRFVVGQTSSPKTFNAIMANETSSTDVTNQMFLGLWDYDNGSQRETPLLAKSYEVSPDGLTYTFHLRRGAAFSDGHPITSDDVMFSFQVCYDDTLHPSIRDLLILDGRKFEISAPDSYTFVVRIPKPYALATGALGSVRIMPKHKLEAAWKSGAFASAYGTNTPPAEVVTSGAWKLKAYVANEKTVLERNPYHFGVDAKGKRLPYLDEFVFQIVPDQNTAALKFIAGELDALDNVKPEDYRTFEAQAKAGGFTLHDLGPAMSSNFFWFNLNRVHKRTPGKKLGAPQTDPVKYAWFADARFRRAVSMAVDRDAIIRGPFFGWAVKNWSTITPGNKVWHTGATGADYDPEGAKRLLAEAGFRDTNGDGILEDPKGNRVSFSMKTNGDNNVRVGMMTLIKGDLAKVGIEVVPSPADFNTLITNLREDFQYESALLGLQTGVPPDPGMGQNTYRSSGRTHYWHLEQPKPETPAEAQIDALIERNVSSLDPAVRLETWREIQRIVNDETFVIWLPTQKLRLPVRNRFGNMMPSIVPPRIWWCIDRVYVKRPV